MDIKTLSVFNKILPNWKPRLLMGSSGLGKSSIVKQFAADIGYDFIDLRLSELEPSDLVGLPQIIKNKGGTSVTSYAQPHWWPLHGKVVIHLDEMDRAREDMQPIAMQLSLDKRAGNRQLPDGVIIFASCNGEEFMTSPIDQALLNRFAKIDFTPTESEWLQWGDKNNIHSSITSFIRENPDVHLDTPDKLVGIPNIQVPTRRSWSDLSVMLNNLEETYEGEESLKTDKNLFDFVKSHVGVEQALAFVAYIKTNYIALTSKDIFSGKANPSKLSLVQVSSLTQEICDLWGEASKKQKHNAFDFFIAAGAEVYASFFSTYDHKYVDDMENYKPAKDFTTENLKSFKEFKLTRVENQ